MVSSFDRDSVHSLCVNETVLTKHCKEEHKFVCILSLRLQFLHR